MASEDALIGRLLGEAEEAVVRLDWTTVQARCDAVLALEPGHERAIRLGAAAARALGSADHGEPPRARRHSAVNKGRRATGTGRSGDVESLLRRADTAADAGDWPTVKDLARQALAIETDNASAYLLVAEAEFGAGEFDDAARSLDSIIDMVPADARLMTDALLMAAEVAWERSDWKGVRSYAKSVLDGDPENEEAQNFLDDLAHGARTGWLSWRWLWGIVGSVVFFVTLIALTAADRSETDSTRSSDVSAPVAQEWSVGWSTACQAALAVVLNELKSQSTAKFPGGSGLPACGYQQVTTGRDAEGHGLWTLSGTVDPGDGSKVMQYVVEIIDMGDGTADKSRLVSLAAAPPSASTAVPSAPPSAVGSFKALPDACRIQIADIRSFPAERGWQNFGDVCTRATGGTVAEARRRYAGDPDFEFAKRYFAANP